MFIGSVSLPADIPDRWPFTMEPVRHLAGHGLRFDRPVTFLVGENGSGKSTLIEALADASPATCRGCPGSGARTWSSKPRRGFLHGLRGDVQPSRPLPARRA